MEKNGENLEIKKSKESAVAETLRVTQILKQAGVEIESVPLTYRINKKFYYLLLKDIKQDGIDMKKIIEENGLDEEFKYGSRVLSLRKAYNGTGECAIKEHEKILAKELGLLKCRRKMSRSNRKEKLVEETIKVAQILKQAGVDIRKLVLSHRVNGKLSYIKLKDIKQDGIDINKVIKENGLDENFQYGMKMTILRQIYKGKANHPMTESEKKLVEAIDIFRERKSKEKITGDEVLSKKTINKRLREETISIAYILKKAGVDLRRIPLTYIKDKKRYFVKLKEIIQLGVNMNGIIEDYELDKNFEYGKGVISIKQAYKTKNGLTEEQKEIVEELGLVPGKLEVRESQKQQAIEKNKQAKELYKQYEEVQRKEVNIDEDIYE